MAVNGTSHHERKTAPRYDFDVCVVGHITKDIVKVGQTMRIAPGGTAYYTALALKRLGLTVAVVTKGAKEDRHHLLRELTREKVPVFWKDGQRTSTFENIYSGPGLDTRTQVLRGAGTPFSAEDVTRLSAWAFHFGPLVKQDIPLQILKQAAAKAQIVSLDVQGMVRPARLGMITQEDWTDKEKWLECVHILKADETEAFILSGQRDMDRAAAVLASFGPIEVVITLGSRGSLIYAEQRLHKIPSWPPRKLEDPTGCGDTYMAGYLYERLRGTTPETAARFAAAMAALKLESLGPFMGGKADIHTVLSRK
jgi:sugar/nucleoside kinase (ribokinase family)